MGRVGRPPKPTVLRVLEGGHPERMNHEEPTLAEGTPDKAVWLSEWAAEEWDRVLEAVLHARMIKPADAGALVAYCESYARLRWATITITEHGLMSEEGLAAARVAETASATLLRATDKLGLNPSARSGIHVTHHNSDEPGAERLLG